MTGNTYTPHIKQRKMRASAVGKAKANMEKLRFTMSEKTRRAKLKSVMKMLQKIHP